MDAHLDQAIPVTIFPAGTAGQGKVAGNGVASSPSVGARPHLGGHASANSGNSHSSSADTTAPSTTINNTATPPTTTPADAAVPAFTVAAKDEKPKPKRQSLKKENNNSPRDKDKDGEQKPKQKRQRKTAAPTATDGQSGASPATGTGRGRKKQKVEQSPTEPKPATGKTTAPAVSPITTTTATTTTTAASAALSPPQSQQHSPSVGVRQIKLNDLVRAEPSMPSDHPDQAIDGTGTYDPIQAASQRVPQSSYMHTFSVTQPTPPPPPPAARSSGRHYDPIRSAFDSTPRDSPSHFSPPPNHAATPPPPRPSFRASESPAISSIIDPPAPPVPHPPASAPPAGAQKQESRRVSYANNNGNKPVAAAQSSRPSEVSSASDVTPMDIDGGTNGKQSTAVSTPAHESTPKSWKEREKEAAATPLPRMGLVNTSNGNGNETVKRHRQSGVSKASGNKESNDKASGDQPTPNIVLHVPLSGKVNQVINFSRLAEQTYGFDALYPRLAAARERRARVSAASEALERNEKNIKGIGTGVIDTEDDQDSQLSDEGDGDGSGSGSGTKSKKEKSSVPGASGDQPKRTRRRKLEEYDREDPFVDDSEMAWQEHAAASKDGFFVYSGPLVPEGEKVTVERYVFFMLYYYVS